MNEFIDQMEKGYQEMAELNLQIANEFLIIENEAQYTVENKF